MASPARRKLIQVDDEYWEQLYARFLNNDPGLEGIISADLYTFLHDLATSKFTTIGMLFPSILTSINYVLGAKGCVVTAGPASQKRNMNTFMIIVGQPSTGKTPALETAAWDRLSHIEKHCQFYCHLSWFGKLRCKRHEDVYHQQRNIRISWEYL